MSAPVGAMKARLKQLELRRGEIKKQMDDLQRESREVERDARILAGAIDDIENPKPVKPEQKAPAKSQPAQGEVK